MVDRTIAIPHCEECPPLTRWPDRNLITGQCPRCGRGADGRAAVRVLKARRLVRSYGYREPGVGR